MPPHRSSGTKFVYFAKLLIYICLTSYLWADGQLWPSYNSDGVNISKQTKGIWIFYFIYIIIGALMICDVRFYSVNISDFFLAFNLGGQIST